MDENIQCIFDIENTLFNENRKSEGNFHRKFENRNFVQPWYEIYVDFMHETNYYSHFAYWLWNFGDNLQELNNYVLKLVPNNFEV